MLRKSSNIIQRKAFAKQLPSAFIVGSPLQLLCAIEAEKEFDIENGLYVIYLYRNSPRNYQILSMVDTFKLHHEIVYIDDITYEDMEKQQGDFSNIENCPKYERIFIGDFYEFKAYGVAYKYVKRESVILYLDDGNASVLLLQGKSNVPRQTASWRKKLHWLFYERNKKYAWRQNFVDFLSLNGIVCTNCFFTLFNNIHSRQYIVYPNSFEHIRAQLKIQDRQEKIVIVGTIFRESMDLYHFTEETLEAVYYQQLADVRRLYPSNDIIYIPHGRDTNDHIPIICNILNIKYTKISEAVEWYLLNSDILPIAIYGQGSTALYTLKKLFPESKVINWFIDKPFDTPNYYTDNLIARYYAKQGIIEKKIKFPNSTIKERVFHLFGDVSSLCSWAIDHLGK